jgi:hypothetical protein
MFNEQLKKGKIGESQIAEWLKSRGNNILPIYEIEKGQYAGPAVYTADGRKLIAPDLLAFKKGKIFWIEAKHKNAFTFHRITQKFVTGIDIHHYEHYQEIAKLIDWPVWLFFLHREGVAKDSPPGPFGLFANDLNYLKEHENHRHENWGNYGMVYWAVEHLKKLADYPLI